MNRILRDAIHHLGWSDSCQLVDRWHQIVAVVELCPRFGIWLNALRPFDRHRITSAAEVRPHQLQALVRRAAGPGPACVIHIVDQRGAKGIQSSEFIEHFDVLIDLCANRVLCKQL